MIVSTDIANIIYRDCEAFNLPIIPFGKAVTEQLDVEYITIHIKGQVPEKYWEKCFVDVNICVPDLQENEANTIRLNELERKANNILNNITGTFNGTIYRYKKDTFSIEADTALKCHFINCRLLFNVLNVK